MFDLFYSLFFNANIILWFTKKNHAFHFLQKKKKFINDIVKEQVFK